MSLNIIRTLARSLPILPAVLLFQTGIAAAADSVDDFMQQQRDLLAGRRIAPVTAPSSARHSSGEERATGDAQESARRLLLGVSPERLRPDGSGASGDRAYGDAQLLARELLLGTRGALAAVSERQSHPPLTQRGSISR